MFEKTELLLIESLSFDELPLSLFLIARLYSDLRCELLCYPGAGHSIASDLRAIEIIANVVRALLAFAFRRILQRFH